MGLSIKWIQIANEIATGQSSFEDIAKERKINIKLLRRMANKPEFANLILAIEQEQINRMRRIAARYACVAVTNLVQDLVNTEELPRRRAAETLLRLVQIMFRDKPEFMTEKSADISISKKANEKILEILVDEMPEKKDTPNF